MLTLFAFSCAGQYDKELKIPDTNGHGYNLTPLGCLLYAPWQYEQELMKGHIVIDYLNGERIFGEQIKFSKNEEELVFELQRDGTIKYWFSRDYLQPPIDTLTQGNGAKVIVKKRLGSKGIKVKDTYHSGFWKANFTDSTIQIDFGKNAFDLKPIYAKWILLGSGEMTLEETIFFDGIYRSEKVKLKRITTSYFKH
jgi:hypothetical protein